MTPRFRTAAGMPLDGVVGAAHLEGPDRLELFALEGHRVPHERGERRHLDERRPDGDALDRGGRAADVVDGDGGAGGGRGGAG